jgi:hypothetical protein
MSEHPFRQKDLAERNRAIEDDIARKHATRPKVDANGTPTGPPVLYEYDRLGMLIGKAKRDHGDKTAEEAGIE